MIELVDFLITKGYKASFLDYDLLNIITQYYDKKINNSDAQNESPNVHKNEDEKEFCALSYDKTCEKVFLVKNCNECSFYRKA